MRDATAEAYASIAFVLRILNGIKSISLNMTISMVVDVVDKKKPQI